MKHFVTSLAIAMFSIASIPAAFAGGSCPPGASCSENFVLESSSLQVNATTAASPTKTETKPNERDLDPTITLTNRTNNILSCEHPDQKKINAWLEANPQIIIDWKELQPILMHFNKNKDGDIYCEARTILHYHYVTK